MAHVHTSIMFPIKSLSAPLERSFVVQPVTKLELGDKESSLIPTSNKLCVLEKVTEGLWAKDSICKMEGLG